MFKREQIKSVTEAGDATIIINEVTYQLKKLIPAGTGNEAVSTAIIINGGVNGGSVVFAISRSSGPSLILEDLLGYYHFNIGINDTVVIDTRELFGPNDIIYFGSDNAGLTCSVCLDSTEVTP